MFYIEENDSVDRIIDMFAEHEEEAKRYYEEEAKRYYEEEAKRYYEEEAKCYYETEARHAAKPHY